MELHEKLQVLRHQQGWTQEELAQRLYVSRTAVSKWESGRGIPGIDSLKAISQVFDISIDSLLSGEELLTLAEADRRQSTARLRRLLYGILDCLTALLLFLPCFGQPSADSSVQAVSLLALESVNHIREVCLVEVAATVAWGVVQLAFQGWEHPRWQKTAPLCSLLLTTLATLMFILIRQPYPAILLLSFLVIKSILAVKKT